jgi:hypothetical protein
VRSLALWVCIGSFDAVVAVENMIWVIFSLDIRKTSVGVSPVTCLEVGHGMGGLREVRVVA